MTSFFNDLFKSLNINITVNEQQALEAIKSIDANYDGTVNKEELFNAFRAMLNTPPPPPPPQIQPNYGAYGQFQGYGGYPQYQQQQYYGGQYPQGYPSYMNQSNQYMNNSYSSYPQNGGYGGGYMAQSNTNYMNQSYKPPQNNQQFNPYNGYKKWEID